ncbi:hypothetical protein RD792_000822 [Penstemon davidsonii]|uniref:Cystatin domain-containing protein n=1 Tax=Penstemon davidsonii TaxID=160366 RepID=A0ABR0DMH1_9LAMI|nr:hypothetical protein RD792_000822 [Penstemon davidsonii]
MAAKSHVVIFAVLLSLSATAAFGAIIPGGWEPIKNPNDPAVVELAKFAVAEYNKIFNKALELVSVEKGEARPTPTDDTTYELYIYTTAAAVEKEKYVTFVWDVPSAKIRELIAFHQLSNNVRMKYN